MKNVKLFLSTVVAFLVIGTSVVNAQQKQSVIVTLGIYPNITIEVIKPDYSIDIQNYKVKEMNASLALKKELDKWLEQGFEIKESTAVNNYINSSVMYYKTTYVLTKEE